MANTHEETLELSASQAQVKQLLQPLVAALARTESQTESIHTHAPYFGDPLQDAIASLENVYRLQPHLQAELVRHWPEMKVNAMPVFWIPQSNEFKFHAEMFARQQLALAEITWSLLSNRKCTSISSRVKLPESSAAQVSMHIVPDWNFTFVQIQPIHYNISPPPSLSTSLNGCAICGSFMLIINELHRTIEERNPSGTISEREESEGSNLHRALVRVIEGISAAFKAQHEQMAELKRADVTKTAIVDKHCSHLSCHQQSILDDLWSLLDTCRFFEWFTCAFKTQPHPYTMAASKSDTLHLEVAVDVTTRLYKLVSDVQYYKECFQRTTLHERLQSRLRLCIEPSDLLIIGELGQVANAALDLYPDQRQRYSPCNDLQLNLMKFLQDMGLVDLLPYSVLVQHVEQFHSMCKYAETIVPTIDSFQILSWLDHSKDRLLFSRLDSLLVFCGWSRSSPLGKAAWQEGHVDTVCVKLHECLVSSRHVLQQHTNLVLTLQRVFSSLVHIDSKDRGHFKEGEYEQLIAAMPIQLLRVVSTLTDDWERLLSTALPHSSRMDTEFSVAVTSVKLLRDLMMIDIINSGALSSQICIPSLIEKLSGYFSLRGAKQASLKTLKFESSYVSTVVCLFLVFVETPQLRAVIETTTLCSSLVSYLQRIAPLDPDLSNTNSDVFTGMEPHEISDDLRWYNQMYRMSGQYAFRLLLILGKFVPEEHPAIMKYKAVCLRLNIALQAVRWEMDGTRALYTWFLSWGSIGFSYQLWKLAVHAAEKLSCFEDVFLDPSFISHKDAEMSVDKS